MKKPAEPVGGRILVYLYFSLLLCAGLAQAPTETPATESEQERTRLLKAVRRVYVDKLGGQTAEQIRDMIINSLLESRVFLLTENPEKADAFLRGSAEDLIFTDHFQYNEGNRSRSSLGGSNSRRSLYGSIYGGDNESAKIDERKHEASASLRLVNKDGDVIWSTTQESRGAKFKNASSDVADKVARRLIEDYRRAQGLPPPKPAVK